MMGEIYKQRFLPFAPFALFVVNPSPFPRPRAPFRIDPLPRISFEGIRCHELDTRKRV